MFRTGLICVIAALCVLSARAEDLTLHTWEKITLNELFYSEGANFADFNGDGKMDIVAGPYWYEGPDFKTKHEYYPPPDGKENKAVDKHGYSKNFFAYTYDFNGDGNPDIMIFGFPGEDASWFENPGKGKDGFWVRHKVVNVLDNESPQLEDITGDGKPEIIGTTGGQMGYFEADWKNPGEPWKFHPVAAKGGWQRFTHGIGVGDLNGDGKKDLMDANGWWEQPADASKGEMWKFHAAKFGGGGAQMYAYDVNGDGKADVVTSIQAHGYGLSWFEQTTKNDAGDITFVEHVILPKDGAKKDKYGVQFSQLHGVDLIDIDGDGVLDIVTGKRHWAHGDHGDPDPLAAPVLYWFKTVRNKDGSVDFIPNLIDSDSGVGTMVKAGDVTGDKLPDVVVGNKRGVFVLVHKTTTVSKEEWEKAQPKVVEAPK